MTFEAFIIPTAFFLDLMLGDPQTRWHPVRFIGHLISSFEKKFNTSRYPRRFTGFVLLVFVTLTVLASVEGLLCLSALFHPFLFSAVSVLLIYFALSARALADEALKIQKNLEQGDLSGARHNLSMIVGRDTEALNEEEIIRATVETVAESTMDGVVSPLFYIFIFGPLGGWAYKAVNTLDSMVGHKNERFLEFGRASAKCDGWLNLLPSKITALMISLSLFCLRKNAGASLKSNLKYLFKGCAENSDATEAAMAFGLGVQLGGINTYKSVMVEKPFLGVALSSLKTGHIRQSVNVSYGACLGTLLLGCALTGKDLFL